MSVGPERSRSTLRVCVGFAAALSLVAGTVGFGACAGARPSGMPGLAPQGPAAAARVRFHEVLRPRLVPLLQSLIGFATVADAGEAHASQKAWLLRAGAELGFTVHDAGLVTVIDLPGPPGSPTLGLVAHGDVQPPGGDWTTPPFSGDLRDGRVYGRGSVDDKGPIVQALLAMRALADAGPARTHGIRLLVGSDEEGGNNDLASYLKSYAAPDLSLILDADFPVTVGEKAWCALSVTAPPEPTPRPGAEKFGYEIESLTAGLAASIVPDVAELRLRWRTGAPDWEPLKTRLSFRKPDEGTRVELSEEQRSLRVRVRGRAAHSGVNLEVGRNALVSLARLVEGELPPGPHDDLLAFARLAGQPLGKGLGLESEVPRWGRTTVNVATIKKQDELMPGQELNDTLTINLRRTTALTGDELQARMFEVVREFNSRTGAHLLAGGYWKSRTFEVDPEAKLVKRLQAAYARTTGRTEGPSVSGGATYAKRLPNALAFGMWFPDKPYPGHDVDESNPVADLELGTHVLIEALVELTTGAPLQKPLER